MDEAILLADTILPMSNGPQARVAEAVRNPLPRDRTRATLHHEPLYYPLRNHVVDFLVSRSKTLAHGRAPNTPVEVHPGIEAANPQPERPVALQRVA